MAANVRKIRPLFTLTCVVFGAFLGNVVANHYFRLLAGYLRGEGRELLWFIPQDPTSLSPTDRMALRLFFVVVGALAGFVIERLAFLQIKEARSRWDVSTPHQRISIIVGMMVGLVLTILVRNILGIPNWATVLVAVLLCYLSVVALASMEEQVRFYFPSAVRPGSGDDRHKARPKLLDTNVIIDGRIADISRAGFLDGPIHVPVFVLEELQQIADSSDSLKRARGRRGLDILNQMQKETDLQVSSYSVAPDEEVDARLVKAAKEAGGAIVTNDYNLNRVAELQGVDVLNINELANAVKPVVLPGEEMQVLIIREGKEKEQGIGYLDDGTMIVVEGARRLIGETLQIAVTSVLQTVQGKMIFGKIKDNGDSGEASVDESVRSYTGGRPRRKVR